MIRKFKFSDKYKIKISAKNYFMENPYFYIDIDRYGFFKGSDIETYLLVDKNISVILYLYYNNLQIVQLESLCDSQINEIIEFLKAKKIKRISGNRMLLNRLNKFFDSIVTYSWIMKYNNFVVENKLLFDSNISFSNKKDLKEVAKFLNINIKNPTYNEKILYKQLLERYNSGCRVLCIKKQGVIVSIFMEYARSDKYSILAALYTVAHERCKGYASMLVKHFSTVVARENKMAILFCYKKELIKWYQSLGYSVIADSAKLEIK